MTTCGALYDGPLPPGFPEGLRACEKRAGHADHHQAGNLGWPRIDAHAARSWED